MARKGRNQYYIQSAFSMDDPQKEMSELRPLWATGDFFKKVVVSKSYGKSWVDEKGVLRIGLMDFLLDEDSFAR